MSECNFISDSLLLLGEWRGCFERGKCLVRRMNERTAQGQEERGKVPQEITVTGARERERKSERERKLHVRALVVHLVLMNRSLILSPRA